MASRSIRWRLIPTLLAAHLCAQPASAQPQSQMPADVKPKNTLEQQQQLERAKELLIQANKNNEQGKYQDAIPLTTNGRLSPKNWAVFELNGDWR